jgi:hypothetical protein
MKKYFLPASTLLFICLFSFTGCIKDKCTNTYKIYIPVYKTLTQIRASVKAEAPRPLQKTGKVYVYGNYVLLNEPNKGIHVINNSNPSSPQNISFINIPGNNDLAVKDGYLYADCFGDLAVIDIRNAANPVKEKIVTGVFPDKMGYYGPGLTDPDSIKLVVDYIEKDTTVNCETYSIWRGCPQCMVRAQGGGGFSLASSAPTTGQGGSTARFTVVNNYLYTVSYSDLRSFNVSLASDPQLQNKQTVGWNIETIFPFENKLFIGSNTGTFIYSLVYPAVPSKEGQFTHANACDPVISDGQYAYVTLRSGTTCNNGVNQLEVLNISNLSNPTLVKTYAMKNPYGLAKQGNLLFICDGSQGLKIYNAADVSNLQLIKNIGSFEPADVILQNNIAMVIAKDGLYQFDFTNTSGISLLSKLSINK